MSKQVFEGRLVLSEEDAGHALLGRVGDDEDEGMFVQLQSWSEDLEGPGHEDILAFRDRLVKVTVEAVD